MYKINNKNFIFLEIKFSKLFQKLHLLIISVNVNKQNNDEYFQRRIKSRPVRYPL